MFLSLVLLGLCICFIILQLRPRRPKNLPPGPPVLPILGNILHLNLKNPLEDFEKLRKSYGNVYSLFLGPRPSVVINGVKAMKEAMVIKAAEFAGRPQDLLAHDVTQRNGFIFSDYGPSWKEHRRFSLMTMRNFGLGKKSMEERIHDETQYIIKTLDNNIGKTLTPQVVFHNAASNIMCQVVFGTRYEYDDEFIATIVQTATDLTKAANGPWAMLYSSFPWIRKLPLPFNRAFNAMKRSFDLVLRSLNEHKKTRVPGEPRDFLDCYLDELDKKAEDSTFSEDKLIFTAIDLMIAGTDTTSNTLLTAFLYLMNHPHIQGIPAHAHMRNYYFVSDIVVPQLSFNMKPVKVMYLCYRASNQELKWRSPVCRSGCLPSAPLPCLFSCLPSASLPCLSSHSSVPEWSLASQLTPLRQSATSTAPRQLTIISLTTHLYNKYRLSLPLPARVLNQNHVVSSLSSLLHFLF
ncbi:cytochrome P450 2F2-like isoform X2 [Acanthochromis polyacanthus]|uniref:cytochrome P450 2F2-like isoform X2 n=1 Tax=Acanthochromis polyacanthus TaxID=80966 RepID=UPI002234E4E0|nr:cytochrome P450 2F2-like isoform X2 [Acanthochromis polyacanthus]